MKKQTMFFFVILIILNSYSAPALTQADYKLDTIKADTNNIQFDMVIITPKNFYSELAPLIHHKNEFGISTYSKTTEQIYSECNGNDKAEEIKLFIKDAVETNKITFVLLLGDINLIPIRETAVSWDYFGRKVVSNVITDLYYSDIYTKNYSFSTWDSNQDNIYSEIHMIMNSENEYNKSLKIIDQIDGKPDVIIGRLPCSTNREVKKVIEKIITYETKTFGTDWFHRLILIGGDTFPHVGGISEGEFVTESISSLLPEFSAVKLWTSLQTFNLININREISKGAGFVSYSGHGLEYGIATSPYNDQSQISYYTPFILGLKNKDKYPIMYFDACLTGKLDYQIFNIDIPCFAWSMIKKQNGGAIACIAATRTGFGGFAGNPFMAGASSLHRYFFEAYEPGILLGQMFIQAQNSFIENIMDHVMYDPLTLQEFTLLGDPSLKIGGYT